MLYRPYEINIYPAPPSKYDIYPTHKPYINISILCFFPSHSPTYTNEPQGGSVR